MKTKDNMIGLIRTMVTGSLFSTPILRYTHTPILLALLALLPLAATAGPINDVPETWDTAGDLAGWTHSESSITLSNPGGVLDVSFRAQSGPAVPQSGIAQAGASASGGRFVGDYSSIVKGISFRLQSVDIMPSAVWLILRSAVSSNDWYINLAPPQKGEWKTYNVPLDYGSGLTTGGDKNQTQFQADLKDIAWVGVYVRRNGNPDAQNYYVDDFKLLSVSPVVSKPKMDIRSKGDMSDGGFEVGWESVSGRKYALWRTTNLVNGVFEKVKEHIDGSNSKTYQEDTNASGMGPYFYRVNVETN